LQRIGKREEEGFRTEAVPLKKKKKGKMAATFEKIPCGEKKAEGKKVWYGTKLGGQGEYGKEKINRVRLIEKGRRKKKLSDGGVHCVGEW